MIAAFLAWWARRLAGMELTTAEISAWLGRRSEGTLALRRRLLRWARMDALRRRDDDGGGG